MLFVSGEVAEVLARAEAADAAGMWSSQTPPCLPPLTDHISS